MEYLLNFYTQKLNVLPNLNCRLKYFQKMIKKSIFLSEFYADEEETETVKFSSCVFATQKKNDGNIHQEMMTDFV